MSRDAIERWGVWELRLPGAASRFGAELEGPDGAVRTVAGFQDGDAEHVVRFSPDAVGTWRYRTVSDAAGLDAHEGSFEVVPASPGNHGPVRVAGTFHFAHADGTPHRVVGATVYNWLHQPRDRYLATLDALQQAGFTKLRFLVFPQGGGHVAHVPDRFPFARTADGWDTTRPDPRFFAAVEQGVADLQDRGIEADVILWHPYDDGEHGLDALTEEQDAQYLDHVVARLGAYRNVWWSLANEYDQLERPDERWDRVFERLVRIDAHDRLRSIHNWIRIYDHNRPWVTHASIQNGWAVAEPGRAVLYRDVYRKPIVLDEIKYEGDTAERWGRLSGRELVHRFWLAVAGGAYASHGESFLSPEGSLHIVTGGAFQGSSPARLGFLRRVLESVDEVGLDPIDKWDDTTCTVGVPRRVYLQYLGPRAPAAWPFALPQGVTGERLEPGDRFTVEVVDTWGMTTTPVPGEFVLDEVARNVARAPGEVVLPEGEALALLIRRVSP